MHYLAEGDQYVKDGAWAVTLSSGFKFNNSNYVESRLSTFQVLILFVLTCMALLCCNIVVRSFKPFVARGGELKFRTVLLTLNAVLFPKRVACQKPRARCYFTVIDKFAMSPGP